MRDPAPPVNQRGPMSDKSVTLASDDANSSIKFPVLEGTLGPQVIDIRKLYGETDRFTYDPGFTSTSSCESKITARSLCSKRTAPVSTISTRTLQNTVHSTCRPGIRKRPARSISR